MRDLPQIRVYLRLFLFLTRFSFVAAIVLSDHRQLNIGHPRWVYHSPQQSKEPPMVHCQKCGAELSPYARFCNKCGQEQPVSADPGPVTQSGLSENSAATLSYVLGWITGLIFFLIDRRPYVRFHAAQSIVTFGGLHIIRMVLGGIFGFSWFFAGFPRHHFGAFGPGIALFALIGFVSFILWIVCMVKAYQGERFMVPIAGDLALNLAGNP